jgi:hypothetical protein
MKTIHRDAAAVDGCADVLKQAKELAIITERDGMVRNQKVQSGHGAE